MASGVAQSVQRLATDWTVRGSNPGGGEIFCTCSDRPWGPPSLLCNRYRLLLGGKERPWAWRWPLTPSSAAVKKEQSYTSTPSMGNTACTELQFLYNGAPLPLPIPLLPLWAVQPVQSLSACTTVHLYLYLYLYSPMGRTACTESQCLYKCAPLPLSCCECPKIARYPHAMGVFSKNDDTFWNFSNPSQLKGTWNWNATVKIPRNAL